VGVSELKRRNLQRLRRRGRGRGGRYEGEVRLLTAVSNKIHAFAHQQDIFSKVVGEGGGEEGVGEGEHCRPGLLILILDGRV